MTIIRRDQDYLAVQELLGIIKEANDVLSLYITYVDDKDKIGYIYGRRQLEKRSSCTGQWDTTFMSNYQVFK